MCTNNIQGSVVLRIVWLIDYAPYRTGDKTPQFFHLRKVYCIWHASHALACIACPGMHPWHASQPYPSDQ